MSVNEAVLSSVLAQVSRRILEKLEKGKKLTTEDILLLYMDMTYSELRDIKEEIRETNKRIDEVYRELSQKIDSIYRELSRRMDELRDQLTAETRDTNRRIDETNRRIDRLYEIVAGRKSGLSGALERS